MLENITKQTFVGGMNKDLDKSLYQPNTYIHAENVRLDTDQGLTFGALQSMIGTLSTSIPGLHPERRLVGYCNIRETLILFFAAGVRSSLIYSVTYTEDENGVITFNTPVLLYYDTLIDEINPPKGLLNFNSDHKITAIGRYETPNIRKVYWVDDISNIRYMNIDDPDLSSQNVDKFDLLPNFMMSRPEVTSITSGSLLSGKIQYCYQLYDINGAETTFSPLSKLHHISFSDETSLQSKDYKGSKSNINCGKGFSIRIDNNTNNSFDKLKLVAIHYNVLDSVPEIRIVDEVQIRNISSININDGGQSIGSYTLEELTLFGITLLKAKDLETKNDILFASNITEEYFDIDFDARAYRFDASGRCTLYDGNGTQEDINGIVETTFSYPDFPSNLELNAVNPYNNMDNDFITYHPFDYVYQGDTNTRGGEGPNIKYSFRVEEVLIDNNPPPNITKTSIYPIPSVSSSLTFTSPLKSCDPGYQRDETYRFGIILFDIKGRQSFVKWIGDIRFPKLYDYENPYSSKYSNLEYIDHWQVSDGNFSPLHDYSHFYRKVSPVNNVVSRMLYIDFEVKNLPDTVYAFQIVRVKRNDIDKTIVSQGIVSSPLYNTKAADTNVAAYRPCIYPINYGFFHFRSGSGVSYFGQYTRDEFGLQRGSEHGFLKIFYSPEISYNKKLELGPNDKLQPIGCTSTYNRPSSDYDYNLSTRIWDMCNKDNLWTPPSSYLGTLICGKYDTFIANPSSRRTIENTVLCESSAWPSAKYNNINISEDGIPYNPYAVTNGGNDNNHRGSSIAGTHLLIKTTTAPISQNYLPTALQYCNYMRNVTYSRYGGVKYINRQYNEYIACSDVYVRDSLQFSSSSSFGTQFTVKGGDTYITYFECQTAIWDDPYGDGSNEYSQVALFYAPVESTINISLKDNKSFQDLSSISNASFLLHETPGLQGNENVSFEQTDYLYHYNKVYSQENTLLTFNIKPIDFVEEKTFDVRVVATDKKTNGELSDSWTKFRTNVFIDVDATYGPINAIHLFNDKLLYWQDKGFGQLSVNQRSMIQDTNSGNLVLGSGGILDRYDYISNNIGCYKKDALVETNNTLIWYDSLNKTIYRYSPNEEDNKQGGLLPVSKVKGMNSYFRHAFTKDVEVLTLFDPLYNDIYFTFNEPDSNKITLLYNEYINSFVSFVDVSSYYYMKLYNNKIFVLEGDNTISHLRQFNVGKQNAFSTNNQYSPITIKIISNDKYENIKIFDNIIYSSQVIDLENNNINIFDETFKTVRCYNDYQNSDTINLVYDSNITRRERDWSIVVPRNAVNVPVRDNPNIFDASNLDTTQQFKERIRDRYMIMDFTYIPSEIETVDYNFSIPYLLVKTRYSER